MRTGPHVLLLLLAAWPTWIVFHGPVSGNLLLATSPNAIVPCRKTRLPVFPIAMHLVWNEVPIATCATSNPVSIINFAQWLAEGGATGASR